MSLPRGVLPVREINKIQLKRRSVQSYVEIGLLPLEDSGSSIAANHTFHR